MGLIESIAFETFRTLLLAAPFLLFGLLIAGLLHVLLPAGLIERWLGRPGMSGVTRAALLGVPLPVCSCGVVPISVEMRRKGASQPASLSFLTTTPESSVDSILFTWGLMGPVMAIARPIAAFMTAVLGGAMAIAWLPEDTARERASEEPEIAEGDGGCEQTCCASSESPADSGERGFWRGVLRPSLRYGFVELFDELAFWLLLGVLMAGVVGAAVPADLAERGLGTGLLPMLLLLLVGIPLYMCASASTPIAAALMAKGVGPGAALVFLLAGPATNVATLVLLSRTFGRKFVQIYLVSVIVGALAAGLMLDAAVAWLGFEVLIPLEMPSHAAFAAIEWASLFILTALLLTSLWRGSGKTGWQELKNGFLGLVPGSFLGEKSGAR